MGGGGCCAMREENNFTHFAVIVLNRLNKKNACFSLFPCGATA
jgi:hypothetical protein